MRVLVFQSIAHRAAWLEDNIVTLLIVLQEESEVFGSSSLVGGLYGDKFPEGSVISDSWIYKMWLGLCLLPEAKAFEVHVIGPSLRINGELSAEIPKNGDKVSYSFEDKLPVYFLKEDEIILVSDDIPSRSFLKENGEHPFARKLTPEDWLELVKKFLKSSVTESEEKIKKLSSLISSEQQRSKRLESML